MSDVYQKYLYNQFRDTYGFSGVPIIFRLKGKSEDRRRKVHPGEEDYAEIEPSKKHEEIDEQIEDDMEDDFDEDAFTETSW